MFDHESLGSRQARLSSHILTITGLAYFDHDGILAGEGGLLCLYGSSNTRVASWRIFTDQAIHGIVLDIKSKQILVFGGRCLQVVGIEQDLNGSYILSRSSPTLIAEDWILDATFCDSSAALVTAHNAVIELSVHNSGWRLHTIVPGANTILYCAHIIELSSTVMLIAAGTAFGDVILWSCSRPVMGDVSTITHYSFSAHEGSTFGVRMTSDLSSPLPTGTTRLLASCSDDRTVRVWDISDLSSIASGWTAERSSGFGADNSSITTTAGQPPLLARVMGHVSRIWHVRFDLHSTIPAVKSFGEDATTITWALVQNSRGPISYSLQQTDVVSGNSGKHIWAVAEHDSGDLAVGGADGAIIRLPKQTTYVNELIDCSKLFHCGDGLPKDVIKSYQFTGPQVLFVATQQGVLAFVHISTGRSVCRHAFYQKDLASYSIVAATSTIAFAAGAGPTIYCCPVNAEALLSITNEAGKVAFLSAHEASAPDQQCSPTALISQQINHSEVVCRLITIEHATITVNILVRCSLVPGSVVTSSTYAVIAPDRHVICLGLRSGLLVLFFYDPTRLYEAELEATSTMALHTEAVTALQWLPAAEGSKNLAYVMSIGRDGMYAIHRVSKHTSDVKTIHRLEIAFGSSTEGFHLTPENELLVYGFRSKQFVVHSIYQQRDLFKIDCGGAHRNWAIVPGVQRLSFAWTKASQTYLRQSHMPDCRLAKSGGHGREIKSMAVYKTGNSAVIATGGQDTDIRLWRMLSADNSPKCLHVLRKHNTGPQHLLFSDDGQYLFSSGGFEEFFVWRLTESCPVFGIGVVCESEHPCTGRSDLRITSFDVRKSMADDSTVLWHIVLMYSDSSIALYSYGSTNWHQIAVADYLTACPMSTYYLSGTDDTLLTFATDGCVAFWNHTNSDGMLTWSFRQQLHHNAILSSCCYKLRTGRHLLATGGDDNAIAFSIFDIEARKIQSTLSIPKAHAAAVTALYCWSSQQNDSIFVVSAGLDQRIILWRILITNTAAQCIKVQKLQIIDSAVADISAIHSTSEVDDKIQLVVGGVGMEHWTLFIPS